MSFIIRITVLCLVLVAIPCIAAASDSADHDRGHDISGVSSSDHHVGNSLKTRDSGVKNANPETLLSSALDGPEQQDRSTARDAASSGEDRELINTKESVNDSPPDKENDVKDASQKIVSPAREEEKISRESADKEKSVEARDITSEKPERKMHNEDSRKELSGKSKNLMGETEENDNLVIQRRIFRTPSGNNERGTRDPDNEQPFAQKRPLPRDLRNAAGHPPAPQIPEKVPWSEVPFASIPALPAGGPPISSATSRTDGTRSLIRNKGKSEHEPFCKPTDSTFVLSPWMLVKLWCFLGFRRVIRKNVLESDERKSLYESIAKHPGVDLSRLTEMLRLNKETARYHLKMLAVNGKISGLIKQGIARYFPCREMISEFEKTVFHYLWIGTTKRILLLLIETPGLTRQAIARELGIAGPSVTWQMQRLADDGLIEMRTEGRFVRYFLTSGSVAALESVEGIRRAAKFIN